MHLRARRTKVLNLCLLVDAAEAYGFERQAKVIESEKVFARRCKWIAHTVGN